MIELRGVAKRYGETEALQATSLTFAKGQVTALIGPSGCGKSTLLRLIAGLIEPSEGQVLIEGQPMTASSAAELRLRMGYVIQDGGLFPHLNAEQNIVLMGRHLGRDLPRLKSRVEQLSAMMNLPLDLLNRYPVELSGGQRQRVSLMRALALDPDILLLDEPFAALDPMVRHDLQTELKDLFAQLGKTVVLVTHDMAEAGYLASRIVLLDAGRVVQDGTLDDLRLRPASEFVHRFIASQRTLVEL